MIGQLRAESATRLTVPSWNAGAVVGGDGELLGQILRAAPYLWGVLLERPDAVEAARPYT